MKTKRHILPIIILIGILLPSCEKKPTACSDSTPAVKIKLLLMIMLIIFCLRVNAQTWTVYDTINSPIPDNHIKAIAVDLNGDKWIGCGYHYDGNNWIGGGLAKFDGTTWIVYDTTNSPMLSNEVNAIVIDASGNKWIGTAKGLIKYDGTTWTLYDDPALGNSFNPHVDVYSIAIDQNNNKWIGNWSDFAKFGGSSWSTYSQTNSGWSTAVDGNGYIYSGSYYGLARLNPGNGQWTIYNSSNSGIPENNVWSIAIDGTGNKWLATSVSGLVKFDGTTWTIFNTVNSNIPSDYVTRVVIDNSGNKWIGTEDGGLAKFDNTNWTAFNTANSGLPDNYVTAIAFAGSNEIWVGTSGGGLAKFSLPTGINEFENQNEVSLFPNPASQTTTFSINSSVQFDEATLHLFNFEGKEVKAISGIKTRDITIDCSDFPSGAYVAEFMTENGIVITRKFIVQ